MSVDCTTLSLHWRVGGAADAGGPAAPRMLVPPPVRRGRSRPRRRRPAKTFAPILVAALAGSATFAVLTSFGREVREAPSLLEQLDRAAFAVGLGLQQVNLSGHRNTADRDIFDTLDLPNVRSLLTFDGRAVEARIRRLPWVATAEIQRIVPGQVEIRITERTPSAVWRNGGREHLIDATGRVLTAIPTGSAPSLPRVAGAAANVEADRILAAVAGYGDIAGRLESAERIGERRWSLRLAQGPRVQLPAEQPEAALDELSRRPDAAALLGPGIAEIDLRVRGRIAVRPADRAAQAGGAPRPSFE